MPFDALNTDPSVMKYFPALGTAHRPGELVDRAEQEPPIDGHGLGRRAQDPVASSPGSSPWSCPHREAALTACTEIGRHLARSAWGRS